MSYENVKLWFAKNEVDSIVTVDEINEENKNNTYLCPVCGSNLKPKAIKSKQVTSHFAHVDASKCNSESQIHFWFKHKFLEKGDKFTVVSDKERDYIVKDILVEEPYETESGIYKPDVTVLTECGDIIYFEMAFTNKKKVKDYLDLWLELKSVVVEIDIKQLMLRDQIPTFNALFYDGKCFNTKRNDTYYNTVGRYKEEKLKGKVNNELKERIRKLDWFWDDIFKYNEGKVDIEHMVLLIDSIDKNDRYIVMDILNKNMCVNLLEDYKVSKFNKFNIPISNMIIEKYGEQYLKYISKIDKESPFYGHSIQIFNSASSRFEACWKSYNLNDYSIDGLIEEVIKRIDRNIKIENNKKLIDIYNGEVTRIKRRICSTKKYREYKKTLAEIATIKGKYSIDYYVESLKYDPINLNDSFKLNEFNIYFTLFFNDNVISEYEAKVNKDFDVKETCELMMSKFNKYFENIQPLKNANDLVIMTKEFERKYPYYKYYIWITGSMFSEDMFCIDIRYNSSIVSLYICNDGVYHIEDCQSFEPKKEVLIKSNNKREIENFIKKYIENKIEDKSQKKCKECGKDFKLTFGEIKFFNDKNFNMPKRCKSCRENKKQLN